MNYKEFVEIKVKLDKRSEEIINIFKTSLFSLISVYDYPIYDYTETDVVIYSTERDLHETFPSESNFSIKFLNVSNETIKRFIRKKEYYFITVRPREEKKRKLKRKLDNMKAKQDKEFAEFRRLKDKFEPED